MKITIRKRNWGTYLLIASNGEDLLIQTDADKLGTASTFGWVPCCGSGATDGSINCQDCGAKTIDMISSACAYLDDASDETAKVDDPGYFDTSREARE